MAWSCCVLTAGSCTDLGAVACDGLAVAYVRERAAEVLDRAARVLPRWGFDPAPLERFVERLATRRVPADEIMALHEHHQSIYEVLKHLSVLEADPVSDLPRAEPCTVARDRVLRRVTALAGV